MRGQIREASVTLRHVQTIRRGAAVYRYLRIPGQPRIRLPDLPPDHPDFLAAYAIAMKSAAGQVRAPAGTIAAAIEVLIRSQAFAAKSDGYRKILRRHLDQIVETAEDAQMRHLRTSDIQADLRDLTPVQARDRMKAWRMLCGHALTIGMIASDPSEGVRREALHLVGHEPWTMDQIETYRARWVIGTIQRACMELLYWTGARRSDAVLIGPGMVRDGILTFRQSKTADLAHVPWTCAVPKHAREADRAMMHEALAAVSTGHMTFLATRQGRTRSSNAVGNLISAAAGEAGFDRSAHGLRKSRAIALAEGGANPLEIGAWTGHRSLSEVSHYVDEADRKRMVRGTEQDQNFVNTQNPAVNSSASG